MTRKALINALQELINFSVENRTRLDALERTFKQTNPLLHEAYVGEIEVLTKQQANKTRAALITKLVGTDAITQVVIKGG